MVLPRHKESPMLYSASSFRPMQRLSKKRLVLFSRRVFLLAELACLAGTGWLARQWLPAVGLSGEAQHHALLLAVLAGLLVQGARRSDERNAAWTIGVPDVMATWAGTFALTALLSFLIDGWQPILASWWALWGAVQLLAMGMLRTGMTALQRLCTRKAAPLRAIVVGESSACLQLQNHLSEQDQLGIQVTGWFGLEPAEGPGCLPGGLAGLKAFVDQRYVEQIWLALPPSSMHRLEEILEKLAHTTADIKLVPDLSRVLPLNESVEQVMGMPVINLRKSPNDGYSRTLKRLEDVIVGSLILLMISPLMVLLAIGVKLSSPGPVFFKQKRHGRNGQEIEVWKFRSMRVHQEEPGKVTQAKKGDSRITPFGAFLRRTSLDELPQFINVLQGQMSIVGPRPHALAHNFEYMHQIDGYMQRHRIKPGITGWAQVNGFRGETDTLEKMQKRVEYDLHYLQNWSLLLDLKIIFFTIFKGFVGKNAY